MWSLVWVFCLFLFGWFGFGFSFFVVGWLGFLTLYSPLPPPHVLADVLKMRNWCVLDPKLISKDIVQSWEVLIHLLNVSYAKDELKFYTL